MDFFLKIDTILLHFKQ